MLVPNYVYATRVAGENHKTKATSSLEISSSAKNRWGTMANMPTGLLDGRRFGKDATAPSGTGNHLGAFLN
jgi:hypothetical protein